MAMTTGKNGRRPLEWPGLSPAIRKTMAGNRGSNTKPELFLRSAIQAMGYRFRTHDRNLPGTPDIVFSRRKRVICVNGCFWHSHPGCGFAAVPKTRPEYWVPKLARNRERDAENLAKLSSMGWESIVVWECEMRDPDAMFLRIRNFLGPAKFPKTEDRLGGAA